MHAVNVIDEVLFVVFLIVTIEALVEFTNAVAYCKVVGHLRHKLITILAFVACASAILIKRAIEGVISHVTICCS